MNPLRIATRQSPLALWQAHHVAALLRALHPGLEVSLVEMTTAGDRFLAAPLAQVGGKGLFVKELEQALLDGRADLAVHSLKDMTSHLPPGLVLATVPEREDPRDALVSPSGRSLESLPFRARVGTASQRRSCLLRERRPDLEVVTVRGNVQTRLRKLEEGLDALMLAYAGLKRLSLEHRVSQVLSPEVSLPAVGQGVLGIECREDDARTRALLAPLEHPPTRHAVVAERALLSRMEGGCTVPMAGYAVVDGGRVWLRGMVGRPDGTLVVRGEREGRVEDGERLGLELAEELLSHGGAEILRTYGRGTPSAPAPDVPRSASSAPPEGRLAGKRVLVTRPRERAEALCFLLEDEGAEVEALPLLELLPPTNPAPLRAAAEQVGRYRWVLFTSPAAVEALAEALREAGTLSRLSSVKLGAVGPRTAHALEALGLQVAVVAERTTGLGLAEALRQDLRAGDEVLLPAAEEGRRELQEALEGEGIPVTRVAAYRAEQLALPAEVRVRLAARPPDVVVLASPRTAEALWEMPGGAELLTRARVVAIGPTTSAAVQALEVPVAAVARTPTPEGLLEAVVAAR